MSRPHVLLLGGTAEARALAAALAGLPLDLTVSLAGATRSPLAYAGRHRTGGFGGAEGLAHWLAEHGVVALIDATHPFAARISANALAASGACGCPLLRLGRPEWEAGPGENWQQCPDLPSALAALPEGARALLTTGSGSVPHLAARVDVVLYLRAIEPLEGLPAHVTPIIARPPFAAEAERALMERLAVTHLITRNSGGAGRGKLAAAAALGIPVLMVERPALPEGVEVAGSVAAARDWVCRALALDSASGAAP